jgi:hypothetical protein
MSFILDIPTISIVIASASVMVSAAYFMLDTRHQRRIRKTENIIKLSPWFSIDAKEIQEAISNVCSTEYTDYKDYLSKYAGKPEQTSLKLLGNYFEGIGLLVYMKLVDMNIVFNFWGDVAESVWDDNEKVINGMRKDIGTPFTFQYWEYLVKEFKKRKIAISKNNCYKARGLFIAHHNKARDSLNLRI